ncbi:MAG: ATP-dependent DNA ligase [Beijerinckiaceae bacterium]|nr:ATP-dependent DNA ligase [Beijerinckiaceae bacterium]
MAAQRKGGGLPIDIGTQPMEALLAAELPAGPGWQYEPKWDGFRCLAFRSADGVDLRAKSGKPLGRYFPEIVAALERASRSDFVIDGELVIRLDGALSFDALQMRLHPAASRILKLSEQTPAQLIAFDALYTRKAGDIMGQPLSRRRQVLEALVEKANAGEFLKLSACTDELAKALRWLERSGGAIDGVVAKQLDAPYRPGERAMIKAKQARTADCVVGGFRYATGSSEVGSLLLGLFDEEGLLNHVGFVSGIADRDRAALTKKVEKLAGGPGFTGKAPGGPSRWNTERSAEWTPLKHKLVAEVRFDQVTGDRMRHGAGFVRWRPDKAPAQCTMEQIRPAKAARLLSELAT